MIETEADPAPIALIPHCAMPDPICKQQWDVDQNGNWTQPWTAIGRFRSQQLDAILSGVNANAPYARPIADVVRAALADTPVVCVSGPRQAGKTTLARGLEPGYHYLSLDDDATREFANADPTGFVASLPGQAIVDEVQRAPGLFPALKMAVDNDRRPGRLLLTGSANLLLLPQLGDSLAGRMEVIELMPLTAAETARAPGRFLATMLTGELAARVVPIDPDATAALAGAVLAGGYPEAVARTPVRARSWHRQYLRALVERDVQDIARVRDASQIARLLEVLALRTGQLLNLSSLGNELGLRRETVDHYLGICERLYLVRRLAPWHRNQAKRLIKTPKVHLLDSGLAATLAGVSNEDWMGQRDLFGHLLESFVVQQLVAQAGWSDPDLRFWHYRDKDQVEVDLVVTRGRKVWGVEVKMSSTVTRADGHGLGRLAAQSGPDFQGGVLLYAGSSTFNLDVPGCVAAPMSSLWEM